MERAAGAAAMAEALKQLDMAALMGGPALRPVLDAAIAQVQTKLRAIGGTGVSTDAKPASRSDSRQPRGDGNGAESTDAAASAAEAPQQSHPAKRRRIDDPRRVSQRTGTDAVVNGRLAEAAAEVPHHQGILGYAREGAERARVEHGSGAARERPEDLWPSGAAFSAAPPPDSLSGRAIATVELPSLERREDVDASVLLSKLLT